jgi:dTDP-4-amino-4,6-dideoxygalactose transaminase
MKIDIGSCVYSPIISNNKEGGIMGKLAINGGKAHRQKPFPDWPVHGERERELLLEVLESGKWWFGDKVHEFEAKFAEYHQARYGITTSNGTASLQISLQALEVADDEVIIPAYTFIATATCIMQLGAVPVFIDIDPETYCMDPARIEEAITDRTKVIMPVHFGGRPTDMDGVLKVANLHNLRVVEDAAQAHSAEWNGHKVGAIGDCGGFSFQMSKNITAGEGGIILTNDEKLADLCWSYSNCGRSKKSGDYGHHLAAGNYRMTEFQAAILLAQLERLEEQSQTRHRNAEFLTDELSRIEGIRTLKQDPRITRNTVHIYIFTYDKKGFGDLPREKFLEALRAEGIPCSPGYDRPIYGHPLFHQGENEALPGHHGRRVKYRKMDCPSAERLCQEAVWFKQSMFLGTEEDMNDIVEAIKKIQKYSGEISS